MKKRKPELLSKFLPGINPSYRLRHRGLLRSFHHHESASISDISDYIEYAKRKGIKPPTCPVIGDLEADGFYYFYLDEYISQAESMQEAATILKRNRSTLTGYTKEPTFPKSKNLDGKKSIDIIAAQDWILWNTEHHQNLEPYWPDLEDNALITLSVEESKEADPLFTIHHAESQAA